MERSGKSDGAFERKVDSFAGNALEATLQNGAHLILTSVVEEKYTTRIEESLR
jgi:hypothetical protein